jgi:hypothetical protein
MADFECVRKEGMNLVIWWTSNAEADLIGEDPETVKGFPLYLRDQFQSRLGRNGRGRLWIPPQFSQEIKGIPWPEGKDETPLVRYCAKAAGIVLDVHDVPVLLGFPGVVTDLSLHQWLP